MSYLGTKRKVFISYYKGDSDEVNAFIDHFANEQGIFTPYVLGANDNDDFIYSTNTDYVMSQIRKKYLQDTTVTILLIGSCTHSRRYVDWEIKRALLRKERPFLTDLWESSCLVKARAHTYLQDYNRIGAKETATAMLAIGSTQVL